MKKYLELLRVKHYIKNLLIFLPIFFNKSISDVNKLIVVILGYFAFSFVASCIYIINDIKDIEKDKNHPIKKNRPIPSGKISKTKAILIAMLLFVLATTLMVIAGKKFIKDAYFGIIYLLIYFLLNVAYSFGLKNKSIIDVVILASGFVIRVLFGGVIIAVEISDWLYLTILAISFYLGLGKRRNEIIKYKDDNTRDVLKKYSKDFLDKNMSVSMMLAITFYALWAREYNNDIIIWTVPVVMIMALRYSYNVEKEENEGDPTNIILKDVPLLLLAALYVVMGALALYF